MNRVLRLGAIGGAMVAIFLAIVGLRLLFVEASRAYEAEIMALRARAEYAVADVCLRMRTLGGVLLARLACEPDEVSRQRVVETEILTDPRVLAAFCWVEGKGIVWPQADDPSPLAQEFLGRGQNELGPSATWNSQHIHTAGATRFDHAVSGWLVGEGVDDPDLIAWVRTASNEVWGIEFEPLAFLARTPEVVHANGVDSPNDRSKRATSVEVWDKKGRLLMPSPWETQGKLYGEAELSPILPGWIVRVKWRKGDDVASGGSKALLASGLCLTLLALSVLTIGAIYLLWIALRARQQVRIKSDFVSNVSHELKTPLTSIQMCGELLESGLLDGTRSQAAAHSIVEEAGHLSKIVSNLIFFNSLDITRHVYVLADFELAPLVKARCPTCDVDESLVVHADAHVLDVILRNLLENAEKYAQSVGVEVRAERRLGKIALSVLDRGPGVSDDEIDHLFDRYWRGKQAEEMAVGGTGLGLNIARSLARGMGSDLTVRRRDGGGLEFTMLLKEGKMENG